MIQSKVKRIETNGETRYLSIIFYEIKNFESFTYGDIGIVFIIQGKTQENTEIVCKKIPFKRTGVIY